ncbi:hypothetical protein GCM10010176_078340 [Nonomuraea spiralis]|nr:hypothetical protein GCM10010176_078340 [Nonomuraea spiralis]
MAADDQNGRGRMGIFYDYYRAADRRAAAEKPEIPRAVEKPVRGGPAFDAVDAKGIDPEMILGRLIALAREIPFSFDLVQTSTVHPPPEGAPATMEEWEALPDDSPYKDGPGIEELSPDVRDTLADIPDDRVDVLVEQWEHIEEFANIPPGDGYLLETLTGLRDLARRAQKENELLYCWIGL